MRGVLFSLVVVSLMLLGTYSHFSGGLSLPKFSFSKAVAPIHLWDSFIIGKWSFQKEFKGEQVGWKEEGNVEYFKDSSFIQYSTIKGYSSSYEGDNIYDEVHHWCTAGGMVKGKWEIDTATVALREYEKDCFLNLTKLDNVSSQDADFDICVSYFLDYLPIGNYKSTLEVRWIERFNEDELIIAGQDFSNNATIRLVYKKKS